MDIINDRPECRVLKSDQNSVNNCDDCCRSCSCGHSSSDSSDPDHDHNHDQPSENANGECLKENMARLGKLNPSSPNEDSKRHSREKISKSSTGTQTSRL